jgi:hypothetical protein
MLPDQVAGYDMSLIKNVVGEERFQQLVQDAFDRFFVQHQAHFDGLFERWESENAPA